jgi:Fe-S cluster assembly iron-binding protein IscA
MEIGIVCRYFVFSFGNCHRTSVNLSVPLAGSEVDFAEGLEGAMFVVNNPNATATCGCGASFSI